MTAFRGSASPTQSWNHFRFAVDDGVATITFDRPKKLNALTFEVYADLRDLLTDLPLRDDVRVVVITGTGRGFSSGGDVTEIIGELQQMDPRQRATPPRRNGHRAAGAGDRPRQCRRRGQRAEPANQQRRPPFGRRPGARLRRHQNADLETDGYESRRRARTGQHDAGAADEECRSCGVLRGLPRRTGTEVDRPLASAHEIRNPDSLPRPSGYSHAVIADGSRTVYLAGQTADR